MTKTFFMDVAEVIDAWRIFPRIFLIGYGVLCYQLVAWAMSLSTLSFEQAGLVGTITAVFAPLSNWYMQTGRSWGDR
jgi:hypothetical protein